MSPYVLVFVTIGSLVAIALLSFELLVYRMYSEHHTDWLRFGSPAIFGESGFKPTMARWALSRELMFTTPDWIRRDRRARLLQIVLRLAMALTILGVFGLPIVALLLS